MKQLFANKVLTVRYQNKHIIITKFCAATKCIMRFATTVCNVHVSTFVNATLQMRSGRAAHHHHIQAGLFDRCHNSLPNDRPTCLSSMWNWCSLRYNRRHDCCDTCKQADHVTVTQTYCTVPHTIHTSTTLVYLESSSMHTVSFQFWTLYINIYLMTKSFNDNF